MASQTTVSESMTGRASLAWLNVGTAHSVRANSMAPIASWRAITSILRCPLLQPVMDGHPRAEVRGRGGQDPLRFERPSHRKRARHRTRTSSIGPGEKPARARSPGHEDNCGLRPDAATTFSSPPCG